jgi:hypothetical protein
MLGLRNHAITQSLMKKRTVLLFLAFLFAVDGFAQGNTGTIKGHVQLTGKLPGNPIIRMGMDPMCAKINAGRRVIQDYVVASLDGSLANVFVRLQGNFPQTPVPSQPVVINQVGCIYTPRVVGVRTGQPLQIKNSDALLHNAHGYSGKDNGFNIGQPVAGQVNNVKVTKEEVMLHVQCDIHKWMNAYVGVVTNPYFAVTGAAGTFQIDKVPAGTYSIEVWQERYGALSKTITVKPGATTTIDFAYTGNEKSSD